MARGRGGARQGQPGKAYGNRTDLNVNKAPIARIPGQPYGAQAAQVDAQRAMPVGQPAMPDLTNAPTPDQTPGLLAPTNRPSEPVTAGLPTGPGPGPEALAAPVGTPVPGLDELRAMYAVFPYPGIKRLLDFAETRARRAM